MSDAQEAMKRARKAMDHVRDGVKENLSQCCLELIERDNTGVLPDGVIRKLREEISRHFPYGGEALNIVIAEVHRQALARVTFDEKVAPISIYRIRNDATNLYSTGGTLWSKEGKFFKQTGPLKSALRYKQSELAYEKGIYRQAERFVVSMPAEIKVVKYKLVEVEATSANKFLGVE